MTSNAVIERMTTRRGRMTTSTRKNLTIAYEVNSVCCVLFESVVARSECGLLYSAEAHVVELNGLMLYRELECAVFWNGVMLYAELCCVILLCCMQY
jgi:hypothetical protein